MMTKTRTMIELDAVVLAAARRACPQGWRPAYDAPGTFEELCAAWRAGGPLPVFDGGCERAIYGSPAVSHAFRAWHDATHVALGADFTVAGEIRTAREQVRQARALGASRAVRRALWVDTFGQVAWYARGGGFVRDQAGFVAMVLERGLRRALVEFRDS